MSIATYQRTTLSQQNDTLDAIAYRIYGNKSNEVLPTLIADNPDLTPVAILPLRTVVVLPSNDMTAAATTPTIKLWD